MKKNLTRNQNGFSLVEGLIIVVVLAVIGGVGFYIFKNQDSDSPNSSTNESTSMSDDTKTSSTDVSTPSAYLAAIDTKLSELADSQTASDNAKFKLEKLESAASTVQLQDGSSFKNVASTADNTSNYRLDRTSTEFATYDEYVSNFKSAADTLASYSVDSLGFKKVVTHTVQGPAENFSQTLLSKDNMYCQIERAETTFLTVACVTQ